MNFENTIEDRTVYIYEIVGRKVGSTINLDHRIELQIRDHESWRVVETIPPNSHTQLEIWKKESYWQEKLGYEVESVSTHMINSRVGWVLKYTTNRDTYHRILRTEKMVESELMFAVGTKLSDHSVITSVEVIHVPRYAW